MKVLVGLHDELIRKLAVRILKTKGYEATSVTTLDDMLSEIQAQNKEGGYNAHIMDVNLGIWDGQTCEPAERVYNLIESKINQGKTSFMSVTGGNAIHYAQAAGIPCIEKHDFLKYLRSL
ncbi:response regulator transcription factor [Candidatus Woesearchaeota archaeon]|jgi:CheY-like chemotaxis protein|nr:response regulator transcription factor [Candidatus Woesearchaeota archaeon]MBT4151084.1 response regulator transcription factor [Candidatus Woesearchaeota archaeon]MBT4247036.1 response regulator transcription factor [Candidatus Woesearchaeota archaeon]MBT4433874.1 response regulator transcription factor [Candidatus Woesearchaeota archaeon]MBT7332127.1 response regulator transcription factor [Candidatus Woesearchaeota archaeon]